MEQRKGRVNEHGLTFVQWLMRAGLLLREVVPGHHMASWEAGIDPKVHGQLVRVHDQYLEALTWRQRQDRERPTVPDHEAFPLERATVPAPAV